MAFAAGHDATEAAHSAVQRFFVFNGLPRQWKWNGIIFLLFCFWGGALTL